MDYQRILEEIKERIDIIDFISEYVDLKKTGQNFRALCPFHSEKTPSFFVNPSKKIFHCFGCGKGGDIITFLMEYENIDFQEAIEILSRRAGLEFESSKNKKKNEISKENFYEIYRLAANYYNELLKKSEKAKKYLQIRGITDRTAELFQLGYASSEKEGLYNYLKSKNINENLIKKSGLISHNYDFFRDRIIIPIHDVTGKIIGFGGRLIETINDLPKYINSPDTTIFKKGENIFGLWQAKNYIKEKNYVIMVEGYIDVILCNQYGFKNTVAPLGTALTLEQLKRIKRFTNRLLFVFDGDEAGLTAVERSLSLAFQSGFIVKIVLLGKNEDPASILQKEGERSLKNYILNAVSPVELFIRIKKRKTLTERIHDFLNILSNLNDFIYRDQLLKELSDKSNISEVTLRDELNKIIPNKVISKGKEDFNKPLIFNEEEILLRVVLSYPEKIKYIIENLNIEDLESSLVRNLLLKIKKLYEFSDFSLDKFLNHLDETEKKFISKLIVSFEIEDNSIEQYMNDCIKRLTIKSVDKKIKETAKTGDEKILNELIQIKKNILKAKHE